MKFLRNLFSKRPIVVNVYVNGEQQTPQVEFPDYPVSLQPGLYRPQEEDAMNFETDRMLSYEDSMANPYFDWTLYDGEE